MRAQASDVTPLYMLSGEFLIEVEKSLEGLLQVISARNGVLLDRTGCIMAAAGDFGGTDPETLGATAAGILGALNSLIGRMTTPEVSIECLSGGAPDHIMFFRIDERLCLCLQDSQPSTSAIVREKVRAFITEVHRKLEADRERTSSAQTVVESVNFIESKLNELFRDYKPG